MRTILIGTVESTESTLEEMCAVGFPPSAVVTLAPEHAGRHSDFVDLRPLANRAGAELIAVNQSNDTSVIAQLKTYSADFLFVIGWSQICGAELRAVGQRGAIGFHPAPLPRMRGRAVIPWTILRDEKDTGATLFWMDDGMDSGDILAQRSYPVDPSETARSLMDKHLAALRAMLAETLPRLAAGERPAAPQDHSKATYCTRRTAADGLFSWSRSASDIERLVRAAGRPYGGAFTFHGSRKLVIWQASRIDDASYIALPGQVFRYDQNRPVVRCAQNDALRLDEYELFEADGAPCPDARLTGQPRLGLRLNGAVLP